MDDTAVALFAQLKFYEAISFSLMILTSSSLFACEVFVSEAFALHLADDISHLLYRGKSTDVVPCCELVQIAGQILGNGSQSGW